jgi:hypothetical protein
MKKGWEKRFDKMWFAPHDQTTMMNWEGYICSSGSLLFGGYRSAEQNERDLKWELSRLIKDFIKSEEK